MNVRRLPWVYLLLAALYSLSCGKAVYGLATEQIGPNKDLDHPSFEQPGWPAGMIDILDHDSRVYSIWVNGNENFYFAATPKEIQDLIELYSEIRLRDHVVVIKEGIPEVSSFGDDQIKYNVNFHYLGGIARSVRRGDAKAETYEPTLTIYVDPETQADLSQQIRIPSNVILKSDSDTWEGGGRNTVPKRELWYANIVFDDQEPATDFESGLSTRVTLWEEGEEEGIRLGGVNRTGQFKTPFSEGEIARLKNGELWLTLTVGNHFTAARRDDARLDISHMSIDPTQAKPVKLSKPQFLFGRLLFEDGSPAIYASPLSRGSKITISLPFVAPPITVDEGGYFKVFMTPEQFESAKAQREEKNIYIPDLQQRGRSTARHFFPVGLLAYDKDQAGEVRIPKPKAKDNEE